MQSLKDIIKNNKCINCNGSIQFEMRQNFGNAQFWVPAEITFNKMSTALHYCRTKNNDDIPQFTVNWQTNQILINNCENAVLLLNQILNKQINFELNTWCEKRRCIFSKFSIFKFKNFLLQPLDTVFEKITLSDSINKSVISLQLIKSGHDKNLYCIWFDGKESLGAEMWLPSPNTFTKQQLINYINQYKIFL